MITLKLFLWLIPIGVNVWVDRKGRKPNYLMMFMLRGMASIVHAVLFDPTVPMDYFLILIFQVTSFWILFDLLLNALRGRPALYYDTKEGDSGWIEKIFARLGPTAYAAAKVGALTACILAIQTIYDRFG